MKFNDTLSKYKLIKHAGFLSVAFAACLNVNTVSAKSVPISNFSFESGLRNWVATKSVKSSTTSRVGDRSAKLGDEEALISRRISVKPNTNYELAAFVRGNARLGVEVDSEVIEQSHTDKVGWEKLTVNFNSGGSSQVLLFAGYKDMVGFIDNVKLKSVTGDVVNTKPIKKAVATKTLNPNLPPSSNFDLSSWNLSIPTDTNNNGKSDTINELVLIKGYSNQQFFYTQADGAMVFKVPVDGFKTSKNTKFTRVELREMLRKGNTQFKTKGVGKNNWVFSSAPAEDQAAAGAVDGKLTGTLSVNHVTTTGEPKQVGRVVFAQIHASDDEPIRFYYRKLPNNEKGSIYFAHEPAGKKDIYFDLVGSRKSNAKDPQDGIALGEKFSYEINVTGNTMVVKLMRDGKETITETVDMSESGYDQSGQYMYFKAGAYMQDSTGEADDYAEVVYYDLENSH